MKEEDPGLNYFKGDNLRDVSVTKHVLLFC